ncbi:MAG: hypothetical protein H0V09_11655 [Gemmatimonadetes bacterium]|nr:hypothetical protein [Gemmatimonadota bacterium]
MHRLPVPAIIPLLLLACVLDVGAQDSAPPSGTGEEEVRAVVRAFYFHLSHGDWEALISQILPAKVTARWSPSQPNSTASPGAPGTSHVTRRIAVEVECASDHGPRVDHAVVTLEGKWALARVPACVEGSGGMDEFRLLRVQERWRIVYIAMAPR